MLALKRAEWVLRSGGSTITARPVWAVDPGAQGSGSPDSKGGRYALQRRGRSRYAGRGVTACRKHAEYVLPAGSCGRRKNIVVRPAPWAFTVVSGRFVEPNGISDDGVIMNEYRNQGSFCQPLTITFAVPGERRYS